MPVIYDAVLADNRFAVGSHLYHSDDALDAGAASGISVGYVGLAVLVPEGACVNDAFEFHHVHEWFPWSGGVFGLGHEDSEIWVAIIDIEFAVMIADRGGPNCVSVAGVGGRLCVFGHRGDGVAYQCPVDEIFGVEHR